MLRPVLAFVLLFQAGNAAARLHLRAQGESVSLDARAVPLWQILDRLAQQTGMQVVYEGPKPAALVTTSFETSSPTELLIRLMEGQGVGYAFQTDATGRQVQRLLLGGPVGAATATARATRPAAAPPAPAASIWSEITAADDATGVDTDNDTTTMTPTTVGLPSEQAQGSAPVQGVAPLQGGAPQAPSGAPFFGPQGITFPVFPGAASRPVPGNVPPAPGPTPVPVITPPTFPPGASEPVHR